MAAKEPTRPESKTKQKFPVRNFRAGKCLALQNNVGFHVKLFANLQNSKKFLDKTLFICAAHQQQVQVPVPKVKGLQERAKIGSKCIVVYGSNTKKL